MRRVPRAWWTWILPLAIVGLALGGCGQPADDSPSESAAVEVAAAAAEPPGPEVVATYHGGTVSLREVEAQLRRTRQPADLQGDDLLAGYRRAAETVVIRRAVTGGLGDPLQQLEDRGEYRRLQRQAVLDLYWEERPTAEPAVSEADLRAYYDEHQHLYQQPERRFASHIFRRHREGSGPEGTAAELRELRRRALAGESFAELARQHSDSETRINGGQLGWIGRGEVAQQLEGPLFELLEGDVSDPVPVPSGAVIFFVAEVRFEKQHSFEEVRGQIQARLGTRRRFSLVGEREVPSGSVVLDHDAIESRLKEGDSEATILEIGEYRLTVGELGGRLAEVAGGLARREQIVELYDYLVQEELLVRELLGSDWMRSEGRAEAIAGRILAAGVPSLVDDWLQQRLRERVDEAPEDLRAFHRDNQHLYQTPLRLRLRILSLPAVTGASGKMADVERLRARLIAGELDLQEAASRLGARTEDLGWLEYQQLEQLDRKARTQTLALDRPGFTLPFYEAQAVQLVWVEDRQEPAPLTFDEAAEAVGRDYFERFQQEIYDELAAEMLAEHGFRYFESTVRRALAPPGETSVAP